MTRCLPLLKLEEQLIIKALIDIDFTITPYAYEDEGHKVHLCTKCGWLFSNPYPSPKHRRSHKKHCGTIEGYTVLIGVEAVSDDDHHGDTDKEKSPSQKIEKKTSIGGSDGLRASISGSQDEFFQMMLLLNFQTTELVKEDQ
ncbi:zinc finger, C2H2 [Tanacetum coccineum]